LHALSGDEANRTGGVAVGYVLAKEREMRNTGTWIRTIVVATVIMITALGATANARAQTETVIFESTPEGITAQVWATAEIDPLTESSSIGFEQIAIGSCSATEFDGSEAGPVLVFAESYTLSVAIVGGSSSAEVTTLLQGESMTVPAGEDFRISNGMSDRAFSASAMLLYQIGEDDAPLSRENLAVGEPFADWGDDSFCDEVASEFETTLFVTGTAKAGATQLYIGSVLWAGGATTEGNAIVDPTTTFNAVIISGGMGNAGLGTGRAFHLGPNQEFAMNDSEALDFPGMSSPFSNPGTAPVYALVFGSATPGEPIYVAS